MPSHLTTTARPVALAAWTATVVLCVVVLWLPTAPWLPAKTAALYPPWLWLATTASAAVASAAVAVAAAHVRRTTATDLPLLVCTCAVFALGLLPAASLAVGGYSVWAAVALVAQLTFGALVVLILWGRRVSSAPRWFAVSVRSVVGLAAGMPWVIVGFAGVSRGAPVRDSLLSTVLMWALILVNAIAFASVARTAEKRNARARPVLERLPDLHGAAVVAALAVSLAAFGFRLSWGRSLFGPDAGMWTLRGAWSWPHALVVATLMAWLVRRSYAQPLDGKGQAAATYTLVGAGLMGYVLLGLDGIITLARTAIRGAVVPPLDLFERATLLQIVVVVVLAAWFARRPLAQTSGRVVALVGAVYLLPALFGVWSTERGINVPAFWASPVQVAACLVLLVLTLVVAGRVVGRELVAPRAAIRLALIPLVALHAFALVPAVLAKPLAAPLVVLSSVATLLLLMPPIAADRWRHSRTVLLASAAQLTFLVAYAATTATGFADTDITTVLALLWLVVPVSAVLCCRVRRSAASSQGAASPSVS